MEIRHDYVIELYATEAGECPVKEMLEVMPVKHKTKVLKFFELLEEKGPNLPRPYADTLRGKIRELVVDIQHHGYRFLYFFSGKTIIVTHGFLKKTQKTPPPEIEKAEKYATDWLKRNRI